MLWDRLLLPPHLAVSNPSCGVTRRASQALSSPLWHDARAPLPLPSLAHTHTQIDVPMSNCINSGISKIYILTQFNSTSLNRHLARTYK